MPLAALPPSDGAPRRQAPGACRRLRGIPYGIPIRTPGRQSGPREARPPVGTREERGVQTACCLHSKRRRAKGCGSRSRSPLRAGPDGPATRTLGRQSG